MDIRDNSLKSVFITIISVIGFYSALYGCQYIYNRGYTTGLHDGWWRRDQGSGMYDRTCLGAICLHSTTTPVFFPVTNN